MAALMDRAALKLALAIGLLSVRLVCTGQNLSPRAYVIAPVDTNVVTLNYSLSAGGVVFNDTIPVTNSSGRIGTEIASYFHTFGCFGRSANFNVLLPYAVGRFEGDVQGVHQKLYRSGLAALAGRVSVNLIGAPAMNLEEYRRWKQKTILGASLIVQAPTGQYDSTRLINVGERRWAFKPEVGYSRRWGNWLLDAYGAVWFFTPNNDFFSSAPGSTGPNRQTQQPMTAVEGHLSYDVKPRLWFSLDANFWNGGKTSVNGVEGQTTLQRNSRGGVTAAIPITRHQALKFSYSRGTYVTFGGNFQNVAAAWQYSWMGKP